MGGVCVCVCVRSCIGVVGLFCAGSALTKNTPSPRVVRGIALLCRPPFKELRLRARAADELV